MKNLIIISAGNFGREVYSWSKQCYNKNLNFKGFLDNRPNILNNFNYPNKILGSCETYFPEENDVFICSLGDAKLKKQLCNILLSKGANFTNIIHKSVILGDNVKLGFGIILCPNVVISSDATINDFVSINTATCVGHDVIINKYCQLNSNSNISGNVVINEGATIHGHSYITPRIEIGEWSVIGAGSVVFKNVEAKTTIAGNPARIISRNID